MNKPLSCATQDLLEAAIVQQRRLSITCQQPDGKEIKYFRALPIDIGSQAGVEQLTILTADNEGGILKIAINTQQITYFEALDSSSPTIKFNDA